MILIALGKTLEELKNMFMDTESIYTLEIERNGNIYNLNLKYIQSKFENVTIDKFYDNNKTIGYIKLKGFTFNSYKEFKEKLEILKKENINSLIIDLRDNGGGESKNLIKIASLFLDKDSVIFKDKYKSKEKIYYSKDNKTIYEPVVILVNNNTASCAEILTTTLKENINAKIIGTRTYGKGVGQTVYKSQNYSFKFTSSCWTTPSGKSIDKNGIEPDIFIDNSKDSDLQLQKAREYLISI